MNRMKRKKRGENVLGIILAWNIFPLPCKKWWLWVFVCTRCFSADLRSESVCDLGSQIVSAWSYVFLSGPRKNDSLKILPQQLTTEEFFFGLQRNCVNIIYFQVTTAVAKRSQDEFSSSSDAKITQNLDLMSFCRLRSTSKAKKSTPQMAGIVCDQFVDSWYIPRSFKLLNSPSCIFCEQNY